MTKQYGEFNCPECGKSFFKKKLLDCHMGHHKRNYVGTPKCKKCKTTLNDKNWLPSMKKNANLMCSKCLRIRNREAYLRKLANRKKK
jgi:ribosomal protein L37AE/L43A